MTNDKKKLKLILNTKPLKALKILNSDDILPFYNALISHIKLSCAKNYSENLRNACIAMFMIVHSNMQKIKFKLIAKIVQARKYPLNKRL